MKDEGWLYEAAGLLGTNWPDINPKKSGRMDYFLSVWNIIRIFAISNVKWNYCI